MGQKTDKILERAKINLKEDNQENALRLFNEVLNREPSHPQALRSKAMIKIMNAGKEEAEDFLLFAIKQQPKDDQLYQMLGTLYHNNDQPKKAEKQFTKALKLNANNTLASRGLAFTYANHFANHEKAVRYFTKSISSSEDEDIKGLYFARGCSYLILKNRDKAEQDLDKASSLGHDQAKKILKKYFR